LLTLEKESVSSKAFRLILPERREGEKKPTRKNRGVNNDAGPERTKPGSARKEKRGPWAEKMMEF